MAQLRAQFELVPRFNWAFNRTWALVRNVPPRLGGYSNWALSLALGT